MDTRKLPPTALGLMALHGFIVTRTTLEASGLLDPVPAPRQAATEHPREDGAPAPAGHCIA